MKSKFPFPKKEIKIEAPAGILNQWTYSFKDVATKIYGRHSVKFGGEVTRLFYLQECAGCGVPQYRFFNIWDFLNDAPRQQNGVSSFRMI